MKKILFLFLNFAFGVIAQSYAQTLTFEQAGEYFDKAFQFYLAKNDAEALKYFRTAAENGFPRAQYFLGHMYFRGEAVDKDFAEAVKWFRKAADNNDPYGLKALGDCYYSGQGVGKDKLEADRWYAKAAAEFRAGAEEGLVGYQHELAGMYLLGEGVEESNREAAKWYRKAAEQGHEGSMETLANICYNENSEVHDYAEAAKWYRKLFDLGELSVLTRLSDMYEEGIGVKQDYTEAAKLFIQASNEVEDASSNLKASVTIYAIHKLAKYRDEHGVNVDSLKTVLANWQPGVALSNEQPEKKEPAKPVYTNKILDITNDKPVVVTIKDLMDYVFGCVDIDIKECTQLNVNDYIRQIYGPENLLSSDMVIWSKKDRPIGYNVQLNGKNISQAMFHILRSYGKELASNARDWTYYIEEPKSVSDYKVQKAYIETIKHDLERQGYVFTVITDKGKEYEIESRNKELGVVMKCGPLKYLGSISSEGFPVTIKIVYNPKSK